MCTRHTRVMLQVSVDALGGIVEQKSYDNKCRQELEVFVTFDTGFRRLWYTKHCEHSSITVTQCRNFLQNCPIEQNYNSQAAANALGNSRAPANTSMLVLKYRRKKNQLVVNAQEIFKAVSMPLCADASMNKGKVMQW